MATVESYFESLGRQTAKPFLDEQNLYTETEPDLTKPVNENITKQQEDTSQFFRDNIEMYKQMIKVRDERLKNIFQLTKSGAPLVAAYAEHRDGLKRLDILESEKSRIKFRTEGINFNKLKNKNLLEINKEIGRAKKVIEKNGIYITEGVDGEEIRISTSDELNAYRLMIASLTTSSGRDTARNAAKYFPKFLEIAKKDMPHENGRYFPDLTLDEQVEWWRSLKAYYIGMWQKKDDRFSDGLVVNVLFDAFDIAEKGFFSNIFQTDNEATEHALSEGNYAEAVGIINTQAESIQKENSYVSTEGKVIDEFWGEDGYYNRRLQFWLEYHDGNKQKAYESLDNELRAIFRKGVASGQLQRDVLDDIFTEWAFPNKDGSGLTTFQELNTTRSKNLIAFIDNELDEKVQALNVETLKNKLSTYEENLKKNIFMTQDQFNEYITYSGSHPELYRHAETIFKAGQQGGMANAKEFGTIDRLLQKEISDYVIDNKEVFGISKKLKDTDRLIISTTLAITPAINRAYFEYYEGYLTQYENVEDAKKAALEAVTIDIKNGKFKSPIKALADENYEIKDVKKLGDTYEDMIDKDNKGWVSANLAHEGEMPHLLIGREALLNGGPMPAIYRQLAKLYPDLSAENLLYERLVATKLIKPNDPKFRMYALRLIPESNIQDSRLLTHFPTMTKALQFASLNAEQWAVQTEKLHDKESLKHFDGYGAFRLENGTYSEEIDLRTMSLVDVSRLINENEDAKFGIYGIKGQDLNLTLKYLSDNKLITGDELFDDRFQLKLVITKMKLNQNGQLIYTGDASYLNLSKVSDEDEAEFNRLIGKQGKNIPMFDRLEFLLPYLIRYKANTEL